MSEYTLYHNPGCSKSRGAKEILEARGVAFDLVEYLETPLTREQVESLLALLPDTPDALVRNDSYFKELGLNPDDYRTVPAVAALLAEQPRLMQRPVLVRGDRAVIARPSERVETLLDH